MPELPGILNRLLEGLRDYQLNGLEPPPIVCKATKECREEMDGVGIWIQTFCRKDPERDHLDLSWIHEQYSEWSIKEFGEAETLRKLAAALCAHGYESKPNSRGYPAFKQIHVAMR